MNAKTKNTLLFVVPVVIAGAIIWFVNRRKKPGEIEKATDADVTEGKPVIVSPTSQFPLKQGSRGDLVKELQRTISVTADGIFGPNTEAALITYAGISQVKDQKQLDDLKKKAIGISSQARANDLIKKFNQGGVSMMLLKDDNVFQVSQDVYGAIQYTGKSLKITGGKALNREDYVPKIATKLGSLVFDITRGTLAGSYIIDPNNVTLK